jgi:hypothetical protein
MPQSVLGLIRQHYPKINAQLAQVSEAPTASWSNVSKKCLE